MSRNTQAAIDRALRLTEHLWAHLPQPMQDEMRIAIENFIAGDFSEDAGFYFEEVGTLWPQVQAVIDSTRAHNKGPRCHISLGWIELLKPLASTDTAKWARFFNAVTGYAVCMEGRPDFSDDAELAALWDRTNARPYDAATDKPGWIKVWKRKRRVQ